MLPTEEYERIGEQLCRVASTFLPNKQKRLHELTQKIAGVLYEQYMKYVPPTSEVRPRPSKPAMEEKSDAAHADVQEEAEEEKVDMERLVQDVREEAEEEGEKTKEDDDISSTDSEEERKLTLITQKMIRRNKRNAKRHMNADTSSSAKKTRALATTRSRSSGITIQTAVSRTSKAQNGHESDTRKKPGRLSLDRRKATIPSASVVLPEAVTHGKRRKESPLRIRRIVTGNVGRGCSMQPVLMLPGAIQDINSAARGRNEMPQIGRGTVDLSLQGLRINQLSVGRDVAASLLSRRRLVPSIKELFPQNNSQAARRTTSRRRRLLPDPGESQNKSAMLEEGERRTVASVILAKAKSRIVARITRQRNGRSANSSANNCRFRLEFVDSVDKSLPAVPERDVRVNRTACEGEPVESSEQLLRHIQQSRLLYEARRSRQLVGASSLVRSNRAIAKYNH